MNRKPLWTVTAEPGHSAEQLARTLRDAGFAVTDVYGEIGVVNGHAAESAVAKLRKLKGVADVAPNQAFDVGPPDAEVS